MEGPVSSMELGNLTSSTEYLVSVLPVYESGVGKSLQGRATTAPLPPPGPLTLAAVTPRTLCLLSLNTVRSGAALLKFQSLEQMNASGFG